MKCKNIWEENIDKGFNYIEEDKIIIEKRGLATSTDIPIKESSKATIHFNILPDHLAGKISDAKVIILSLNPCYTEEYGEMFSEEKKQIVTQSLAQQKGARLILDGGYWFQKFKPWKKEIFNGNDEQWVNFITNKVALIEFFPYASNKYNASYDKLLSKQIQKEVNINEIAQKYSGNKDEYIKDMKKGYLPSQSYGFQLLRDTIKNEIDGPIIIITRSPKKWLEAIPELKKYPKLFTVTNPRRSSFKLDCIVDVTIPNKSGNKLQSELQKWI